MKSKEEEKVGGLERDLRLWLRADVGADDDECRLLRCRLVIMRGTSSLLTAHFPPDVSVCVCVCACMCVCLCVCLCVYNKHTTCPNKVDTLHHLSGVLKF